MKIEPAKVPAALGERPQWVLWKTVHRDDRPTKLPYQVNGELAKSNDATTWTTFGDVVKRMDRPGYDGIGYVFAADDPFVGIDLDGCRNPETGEVAQWARDIIVSLDTYAEVSPSKTGVKLFARGEWKHGGKKQIVKDVPKVDGKEPAIEVYSALRYFAVTGWRLKGETEPCERQKQIDLLQDRFWPIAPPIHEAFYSEDAVIERARKYIAMLPPSVSGQGGHNAAFHVACVLVLGFGLPESVSIRLMSEWNQTCQPPWSEHEIEHKIQSAAKQPGDRNYLRNARQETWRRIQVPRYEAPKPEREFNLITLEEAANRYLTAITSGKPSLVELGLPDVDYAIGGGVAKGEVVILAGRPSHGKSAVAMQCVHNATANGMPTLIVSEEMSAMTLGKRAIQYISSVPEEHWITSSGSVSSQLEDHFEKRAQCYVVESVATADAAAEQIRKQCREKQIEVVAVDYAQLIRGKGKSLYEQLTNTSLVLRQITNECNLVMLLLCQLNREIEKRNSFVPKMSDLRETGQLEQDADVILFLCWPHRIDPGKDPHEYLVFVAKNRNRAINSPVVKCKFNPSRQRLDHETSYKAKPYQPTRVTEEEPDQWGLSEDF